MMFIGNIIIKNDCFIYYYHIQNDERMEANYFDLSMFKKKWGQPFLISQMYYCVIDKCESYAN